MSKYYVFLILLIIISLITGVIISIIERKLKKELEAEENDFQTKTNLNITGVPLFQNKLSSNKVVAQAETGFNTTFFVPPVITSVVEETKESVSYDARNVTNKKKNDEVFDAPVLISSEFCEEILEDSDTEDIIW